MLANCAASHLGAWLPHETTVCRSERPALSPAATWHLLQLANDAARSRGAVLAATAVALSVRQLHGRRRCGLLRHHPHRSVALRAEGGLPVRIETKGVPVLLYAPLDQVEDQAREQLISLAESPLPVGHVAAMPDVHMGKGVAIGAVFASEKYVCPNAVGVDIGCGMCAVPVEGLFRNDLSMEQLHDIQRKLKLRIPTSFDSHDQSLSWANDTLKNISNECEPTEYLQKRVAKEEKIARQLGTLGGGNHFIELVYAEEDDQVWCMLHSGSRNVGNTTAAFYDRLAGERGKFLQGVAGSLNYLAIDSESLS